jgi:hypothetical protein
MAQKAKPGEKTILQALSELAGYEDIRTSEDLGKLSESGIFSEWVLPAVTGASAETEEYQPGALDLAFTVPVVGGSLKTGFKLAKQVGKKLSKAYKGSVRPKIFPQKDELLRESAELERLRTLNYGEEALGQGRAEAAADFFRDNPNLRFDPSQVEGSFASRTPRQAATTVGYARQAATPIRTADEVAESIVNEYGFSSNVSWNDAQAIVSDIGEEGWVQFQNEINRIPLSERNLYFDNFIAKYRHAGQLTGQDAAVVYKTRRFSSRMPDEVMTVNKGRHGELKYTSTTPRKGTSHIELEWESPGKSWESATLKFNIKSKVDEAGNAFEEISNIGFFGHPLYSGRLLNELLDKIPNNAVINESSLTYDSLYLLLRQAIKKNAKIVFHKRNPKSPSSSMRRKQSSGVSSESRWSHKFENAQELFLSTGDPKHIDRAVDEIMDEFRGMISQYAKKRPERVVGRPGLEAVKEIGADYLSYGADPSEFAKTGRFEYNFISIHKMSAALAGVFGYSNKEEFMKFLSYDPESTEAQIFDNEFSL